MSILANCVQIGENAFICGPINNNSIIDVTISHAALIFMILMQLLLLRYYGWQFCKAVVKQYGASGTPSAAVKWGWAPIGRRLAVFTNGFGGRSYYNTHAALQLCNITIVPREEPLGLLSCTSHIARLFKTCVGSTL